MKLNQVIVNSFLLLSCSQAACFADTETGITISPAASTSGVVPCAAKGSITGSSTGASTDFSIAQSRSAASRSEDASNFRSVTTESVTTTNSAPTAANANVNRPSTLSSPHRIHKIGIPGLFHIDFGNNN